MSSKKEFTPFFPAFQPYFLGRPNISCKERLKREVQKIRSNQITEFRELFSSYIPSSKFSSSFGKHFTRSRVYTLEVVFWGFLNQIFSSGSSCSEIVKKIQSWKQNNGDIVPSSATGAYCRAKKKVSFTFIKHIFKHTINILEKQETKDMLWNKRVVKVVDGTGLSMPDTKANQKKYPQNGAMSKGCGFPQLNMVALFSLASGVLLGYESGDKHCNEKALWKKLWSLLNSNDVVLGDRGYYSYMNIASLLNKKVDSVIRLCSGRPGKFKKLKVIGLGDSLCALQKPKNKSKLCSKSEWDILSDNIVVRIIKVPLIRKGFRSENIIIVTTLLDHNRYSADDIAKLYFKRWAVEMRFKDIKTTMGMDILSSKTPNQIKKEIAMFAIAYNLIRGLMINAAKHCKTTIDKISFAGALQQLNQWLWLFFNKGLSIGKRRQLLYDFYFSIIQKSIPDRPGRNEPRVKKRRAKNFNLMNKPRKQMIVTYHRNDSNHKNAFFSLK